MASRALLGLAMNELRAPTIVAVSAEMAATVRLARRAAGNDAKVLVTGESGVGKDLIAHEIHHHSARASRPLVIVNCAGLSESLLESELFGHEKGSFTGAYRDKPGQLELADGGTLFLDEVGEMSLRMQALLLRFLENGEIRRIGALESPRRVDTRVIAVTSRNLPERVANGEFREDLLFRLRVMHIHVPPLRARPADIPPLMEHFAARASQAVRFTAPAMELLRRYRWPGNVRELQNCVGRAVWESGKEEIGPEDLPASVRLTHLAVQRERRRQVADELYDALTAGTCSFWGDVYHLFIARDVTRHDIRELVRRGLRETRGSYRGLLALFRMDPSDYQRLHNFLNAHDCKVEFRDFRGGDAPQGALPDEPAAARPRREQAPRRATRSA